MKREEYKVKIPTERVLTRDYWELLQIDPENRVEYTNQFFYKDFVITKNTESSKIRSYLKARQMGWKLYEYVDLGMPGDTVVYRLMKVISVAVSIEPSLGASIAEAFLYSPIASHIKEDNPTPIGAFQYEELDIEQPFGFKDRVFFNESFSIADTEDFKLVNRILKVVDKRVRDKVKGKKVYDEYELLGKERCNVGVFSFIKRHCTQPVYKKGVCFYHWMQMQDKRSGCNPALPGESLHTMKKPYIPSVDVKAIEAKMKQYYEASKPITPATDTPKKPRCKHLLHKDECSICLGRPSATSDSIEGLPVEVDSFMVFNY